MASAVGRASSRVLLPLLLILLALLVPGLLAQTASSPAEAEAATKATPRVARETEPPALSTPPPTSQSPDTKSSGGDATKAAAAASEARTASPGDAGSPGLGVPETPSGGGQDTPPPPPPPQEAAAASDAGTPPGNPKVDPSNNQEGGGGPSDDPPPRTPPPLPPGRARRPQQWPRRTWSQGGTASSPQQGGRPAPGLRPPAPTTHWQPERTPVYRDRPPIGRWRPRGRQQGQQRIPPYPARPSQDDQGTRPASGGWQRSRPVVDPPPFSAEVGAGAAGGDGQADDHVRSGPVRSGSQWQRGGPPYHQTSAETLGGNQGPPYSAGGQGDDTPTSAEGRWQPRGSQQQGRDDYPAYSGSQKDAHHAQKGGLDPNHRGKPPYPWGDQRPPPYTHHGSYPPPEEETELDEMEYPGQQQQPWEQQQQQHNASNEWFSGSEPRHPPYHHDGSAPPPNARPGGRGGGGGGGYTVEPVPPYKWDPAIGRYVPIIPGDPAAYKGDLDDLYEDVRDHLIAQGVPAAHLPQLNYTQYRQHQQQEQQQYRQQAGGGEEEEYDDVPPGYHHGGKPPYPAGRGHENQGQGWLEDSSTPTPPPPPPAHGGGYNDGANPEYKYQGHEGDGHQTPQSAERLDTGPSDPNHQRGGVPPPIQAATTPPYIEPGASEADKVPPSQRYHGHRPPGPRWMLKTTPPSAASPPPTERETQVLSGRHGAHKVEVLLREKSDQGSTAPPKAGNAPPPGTQETPAGQQERLQAAQDTGIIADPGARANVTDPLQEKAASEKTSPAVTFGIVAGCIIGFWLIMGPIVCLACRHRDKVKEKEKRLLYRQNAADARSKDQREVLEAMVLTELGREPLTSLGGKQQQQQQRSGDVAKPSSRGLARPNSEYVLAPQDPAELERLTSNIH